jgi:class 3 adenylate cyclase
MSYIIHRFAVERRQRKVMKTAVDSTAIVSSLFPSNVRDRLFPTDEDRDQQNKKAENNKSRLKSFLSDGKTLERQSSVVAANPSPIADLFPHCTVLFSDISGFTSWSSVREPTQVFILLETLYGAYDKVAMRRGVFKVETIGDAYLAVVGLPEPCDNHAVVMSKFARDCLVKTIELVRDLEKTLGPGTGELRLRFGLHSGAVTAGVLRGQKTRFQLFGDTVNTASRMESTGIPNKIQVSTATADLLIAAGKGSWVKPRDELIEAKGKGKLQTYWVEPKMMGAGGAGTLSSDVQSSHDLSGTSMDERTQRLVDWNTDILTRLVKRIIAKRSAATSHQGKKATPGDIPQSKKMTVLDEVKEIIELPELDTVAHTKEDPETVELDADVSTQLEGYVVAISALYNDNPFHNFDHASHVGMSVAKLLSRIVKSEKVLAARNLANDEKSPGLSLNGDTFGITSDPLTQFACVYSALIHDVDHPGVPNSRLVQDNSPLATRYKGKSVAEQNSVDIAWQMLMSKDYNALRNAICPTAQELKRFRQLVVNAVMATDILDKDIVQLRNDRWERAFSESSLEESSRDKQNRKATIVIEHLIQASDVAHTMQHWNIYVKWNERLFEELYTAYQSGTSEKDPSALWYEGELAFFDSFILPLARKLRDCGAFGASSDEYLNYAVSNREEWQSRGRELVASMVEKHGRAWCICVINTSFVFF